jgi:hypothetical protein
MSQFPYSPCSQLVESNFGLRHIGSMEDTLEQMARSLVESGDYRVTSRLEPRAEYYPPDDSPKLVAAVVDAETTGTNPDGDKIIELGICLFEYDRQSGRIYKVLGCWEWLEDPGLSIPPEITKITGITDEFVAGHCIDDRAVTGRLALQALLERARLPTWRLWAREAAVEKKDVLKARGYAWSPGEFGRPKCWYRDVSDTDRATEVAWLRANVMGPDHAVWALRITAKNRHSDRCWCWGERLNISLECAVDRDSDTWFDIG